MIKSEEYRTVVDAGMRYGPWLKSNQVANIRKRGEFKVTPIREVRHRSEI